MLPCFGSGAAVQRGLGWLRSASPLSHSPALSLYEMEVPKDALLSSPKWACLGVKGKGSATFIYTLIGEDKQRSEQLHVPRGHRPALLLSFLLRLALRTGFHGALRPTRAEAQHKHSGLVLASRLRMGWWNTASSAACDKDYTLAQA